MAKRRKRSKGSSWLKNLIILIMIGAVCYAGYFYYKKDLNSKKKHDLLSSIPEGFPSLGIDISHHQGTIDWEEVFVDKGMDSIIQFVYCKATEGVDHVDTKWTDNRNQLIELNIPHGAYHFFSLNSDPIQQANHFLKHWNKKDLDLPPVLDVETEGIPDSELIQKMDLWLKHVEKTSGMRPVIYTSLHFYKTKFSKQFKEYKFWIASYSRRPDCLEDSRIIHWQYSESGVVPGIEEATDLNVSKTVFL